jgi:hypothetical protein
MQRLKFFSVELLIFKIFIGIDESVQGVNVAWKD